MLNAFLAIAIVIGLAVFVLGVLYILSRSPPPGENTSARVTGAGWVVLWGATAAAFANAGHSYVAIAIAVIASVIIIGFAAIVWRSVNYMAHH